MEPPNMRGSAHRDIRRLPTRRSEDSATTLSVRRISWGAALAGTAVGLVTQLWLSMLGVAIGASTLDPLREANPMAGIGLGSLIWLGASIVVSSFIGGWVSGRLAGIPKALETTLHGALSWAAANILTFALIGGVFGAMVTGAGKLAAGPVAAYSGGDSRQDLNDMANAMTQKAQSLVTERRNAAQSGQLEQQARQVGEKTARAVSGTSWGLVVVMFLGLCAGLGGAYVATPSNPLVPNRRA